MKAFYGVVFMLAATACSESQTTSNLPQESDVSAQITASDAEEYTQKLLDAGLPISRIVVVSEETDENQMMGRPGQYTSKTYFVDDRHVGEGFDPDEQNTIEVFASEDAAAKRREYIQSVIDEMPMFNQYIIQSGAAVLRLDKSLTPAEAREYEAAFGS